MKALPVDATDTRRAPLVIPRCRAASHSATGLYGFLGTKPMTTAPPPMSSRAKRGIWVLADAEECATEGRNLRLLFRSRNARSQTKNKPRLRSLAGSLLLVSFALPSLCQSNQPSLPIALRESVQIDSATVRLSDLLPPDVPNAIRQKAAAINLGRAPQIGSVRTLSREEITQRIGSDPALRLIYVPAQITIRRDGWPISPESIRSAIARYFQAQGWKAAAPGPEGVRWDAGFTSLKPSAALEVTAVSWNRSGNDLEFRLRCVERNACSSLLVRVVAPPGFSGDSRLDSVVHNPATAPGLPLNRPVLVKAGEAAILSTQSGGISISLQVIALQRGALGQTVRARDPSSKRIFEARVVGVETLAPIVE